MSYRPRALLLTTLSLLLLLAAGGLALAQPAVLEQSALWMTPAFTAAFTAGLTGLVIAGFLYLKDLVHNRSLRTTLENLQLNAKIAAETAKAVAQELEASKEADKVQAEKVEKIAGLSVQTHEIVNSQRSQMRADMAEQKAGFEQQITAQKTDFERVIAQLRSDLRLAETVSPPAPAAAGLPGGVQTVTVPAVTVPVQEAPEPPRIITAP